MTLTPQLDERRSSSGHAVAFVVATLVLVWFTHAIAFFAHEYSHSFVAWSMGWKANPWIIDFGHPDLLNFLQMIEIDEKVDYATIFAANDGFAVAVIAAAGVVLGNGVLFIISSALFAASVRSGRRWPSLLLYWLCVVCVGNFLSYVPMRTFANIYDMGHIQQGLHVSPWAVVAVLGIPFAIGAWYLFARVVPNCVTNVLRGRFERGFVVVLTAFVVFVFYALAGLEPKFDTLCKVLAIGSMVVLFPVFAVAGWRKLVTPAAGSG